jgi:hypothetical protein
MPSRHLQAIAHGLVLVAFMLGLIAAALWFRTDSIEPKVQAQTAPRPLSPGADGGGIPDSGRQKLILIEQLDTLNKRLADIERGLREGSYSIQVINAKGTAKPADNDPAKERER